MDRRLVSFTQARVAALAGVRPRRLDYWSRTGLLAPTIEQRVSARRSVRLYAWPDLVAVLVIAELRKSLPLQQIRALIAHVRALNFEPSEIRYAASGSKVFIQHPDGSWTDGFQPGQAVMDFGLLELDPLKDRADRAALRDPASIGQIERRRAAMGSKPLIAETRVPVDTVKRYLARGVPTEEILAAYPILQPRDIEAARNFAA
jgi:uncharacterized protein (DUF433 family)